MMNNARQKKLMWVIAMLVGAVIAVCLILYAMRQQTDYYFDPTMISQGQAPENKRIRAGGMVVAGSVKRDPSDPLNIQFAITDFKSTVPMSYRGCYLIYLRRIRVLWRRGNCKTGYLSPVKCLPSMMKTICPRSGKITQTRPR